MNFVDRQRIEWTLARYDFWMDSRGVPGKVRRGLRDELRANLTDASEHQGSRAAVRAVGSPRDLASVIPLLVLTFVVAAQPWRPLTHRRGRSRSTAHHSA